MPIQVIIPIVAISSCVIVAVVYYRYIFINNEDEFEIMNVRKVLNEFKEKDDVDKKVNKSWIRP